MKKRIRAMTMIALCAALAAASPEEIVKQHDMDPRSLQTVYQCIRAANFREVRGFTAVTREGNRYRLVAAASGSIVHFKSKQLDALNGKLGNDRFFNELLKTAAAYGVFSEKKTITDETGATRAYSFYDAHVLILEHGKTPDDVTIVCMADRD